VAQDGRVELPLLFVAGSDPAHHDSRLERWSPVQSAEKVLLAVRGMFIHPIEESIANAQAEVTSRHNKVFVIVAKQRRISMTFTFRKIATLEIGQDKV